MISFVLYSRPPSRKTGIFQMPARDCRRFRFRVGRTGYLETTYYFQKKPDWRAPMQSMTQQSLAGMTASRHKRPFPQRLILTQAVWIDGTEFNWSKKEIAAAYQGHYRVLAKRQEKTSKPGRWRW
jgi:hypothetical protein